MREKSTMSRGEPAILTVEKPWGSFTQYCLNEPVTVKIITVRGGQELSLQSHQRRTEVWVALDPGLQVEVDGRAWRPSTGEVVRVPAGARHRLAATTDSARVLEVSFGHFDEDDITRHEDRYGRA